MDFKSCMVGISLLLFAGCAQVASSDGEKLAGEQVAAPAALSQDKAAAEHEVERLAALWSKRRQKNPGDDYPIGPGDVLEVNVANMKEITSLSVRVTGDGTISLPFVGLMKVDGMTEKGVKDEVRKGLQVNYMRDPQVSLFVKEFRSRQVAVIGAVQKPGLYNLASSADTVMSMISQAGGMRADAAEHVLFIPAEPAEPEKAREIIDALPVQLLGQNPSPLVLKNADPIVIRLDSVNRSGNQKYLNMPALPGDIVMVPGGGEVLIQGWVAKPGAYKISSGLTILAAMAAAGGTSYPADTGSVELIRTNPRGHKSTFIADLDAIKSGAQPDLPLREGDVINVVSYGPKLFAYGFYRVFTSLVHVGASANIPIR